MQLISNIAYEIKYTRFLEDPSNGITQIDGVEHTTLFQVLNRLMTSIPPSEYSNEKGEMDFNKSVPLMEIRRILDNADLTDIDETLEFENAAYDKLMELTKKVLPGQLNDSSFRMVLDLKELREAREIQKKNALPKSTSELKKAEKKEIKVTK